MRRNCNEKEMVKTCGNRNHGWNISGTGAGNYVCGRKWRSSSAAGEWCRK